jgi:serine/threonine protein kinase/tetratricopeptide (TPR) repeat protein
MALEIDDNARVAFIASVATTNPDLAADLRRLLHQSDASDRVLETATAERSALLHGRSAPGSDDLRADLQASLDGFTIERELGGGGMSRVFVAHDANLDRKVVIKVLIPDVGPSVSAERFARETKVSASLQQANIVPVIAAGSAAGLPYFVMPFVEGRSLRERLVRDGPLSVAEAISILKDIARALAYAHGRGIVHRDIKPGNVLLSGGTAVVTDFGIAKALVDATSTSNRVDLAVTDGGTTVGTPAYMAPEQAIGDPELDHRADIYAFGCLAFEMVTGTPPFAYEAKHRMIAAHLKENPRPVTEIRPDAFPIADLIARCLAKEPDLRPQSATAILDELDRAGSAQPSGRVRRTFPWFASGAIGLTLLLVGIWIMRRPPPTNAQIAIAANQPTKRDVAASRRGGTTNMVAYELYLRGRDPLLMRSDSATRAGLDDFRQAIVVDSTFALAYTGLAHMYGRLALTGDARFREYLALGHAAATKAIAMDDSLAEGHYELGFIESVAKNFSASERELRRALQLDPKLSDASETLTVLYELTERPVEALAQARQTLRLDPMSRSAIAEYARALYENGQCDDALAEAAKVAALRPPLLRVSAIIAQCDAQQSRWADALAVLEQLSQSPSSGGQLHQGLLGNILARSGRRAEAERVRDRLLERQRAGHPGAGDLAMVEAGLGNIDAALAWFDTTVSENALMPDLMGPTLANVRRDPRFDRIRARLGISKTVAR